MIISIKKGQGGFGQYATDRDEDTFTIIEGDPNRIEEIADYELSLSNKRTFSHYSYVLSFKEENLTKDDLFDYYTQFKELMFKNYNPSELEIFSVMHWDDNKPHVHCYVINYSMIDDKELRLYRGYTDFKRVEAVQENINLENNLASPFENINLLSLTKEQKKRDWVYKKGKDFYKTFDDSFYKNLNNFLLNSSNYDDFMNMIREKYGAIIINKKNIVDNNFNKGKLLKLCNLVLTEHKIDGVGHRNYSSKLFDKVWFEKNLSDLKEFVSSGETLIDFKYSQKRFKKQMNKADMLYYYNRLYNDTTLKHEEHIFSRKVGKKYLSKHIDISVDTFAKNILTLCDKDNIDRAEYFLERYFSDCTSKKCMKSLLKKLPIVNIKLNNEKESVEFDINNKKIVLYESNFFNYYLKQKDFKPNKQFGDLESRFFFALKNLTSNKSKAEARLIFEELFYKEKIKNLQELELLLKRFNLKILRIGDDKRKGKYLTVGNEFGKFSIYNDVIYALANNTMSIEDYKKHRKTSVEEILKSKFAENYIESSCKRFLGYNPDTYIQNINQYKLNHFPMANYVSSGNNKTGYIFTNHENFDYERIFDYGSDVVVQKSFNFAKSGRDVADLFYLKGSNYISVDCNNDEFKKAMIDRIKNKNYHIRVIDKDGNLLYTPDEEHKIDKVNKETIDKLDKSLKSKEESLISILLKLENLDVNSRKGMNEFRNIIASISKMDISSLEAICKSVGIDILRTGEDTKKGKYATFMYDNKKIAVYDEDIHYNVESILSLEKSYQTLNI